MLRLQRWPRTTLLTKNDGFVDHNYLCHLGKNAGQATAATNELAAVVEFRNGAID